MLQPGQKVNLDFKVKAVSARGAGGVREVVFRDLLTRRTIISAYMKNNTPSCDRQVADLASHAAALGRAGCAIIMVSRDTASSQLKYALAKQIPFSLIGDTKDLWAHAAGSMVEKQMYGKTFLGPARAAWLVEPDGTILAVIEKVTTSAHAEELEAMIARVQPRSNA